MNEATWQRLLQWEALHQECGRPALVRFLGRPDELRCMLQVQLFVQKKCTVWFTGLIAIGHAQHRLPSASDQFHALSPCTCVANAVPATLAGCERSCICTVMSNAVHARDRQMCGRGAALSRAVGAGSAARCRLTATIGTWTDVVGRCAT